MDLQKWSCPTCNRHFKREIWLKRHLARVNCVAEKDAILDNGVVVTPSQPVSPRTPHEEVPFMEIVNELDDAWSQFRKQLIQILQKQDGAEQKKTINNLLPRTLATLDAQTQRSLPKLSSSSHSGKSTRTTLDLSRISRKSETSESDGSHRGGDTEESESEYTELQT